MLRMLLAPARAGGRSVFSLVSSSFSLVGRTVTKVLGTQLLADLSGFVAALDSMFGGFRARAEQTYRVLQDRETAFLLVAAPEPDAVREAAYFAGRLAQDNMPLAGLVVNRMTALSAPALAAADARAAADKLDPPADSVDDASAASTVADLLRMHASLAEQAERQAAEAARFQREHPEVPVAMAAAQAADIHDLDGLRRIGDELC
jgi:anion-transporting  ArsA/GET3 family ATPase